MSRNMVEWERAVLEGDVKQKVRDKLHKIGFLRIKSRTVARGSGEETFWVDISRQESPCDEMCGSGTEGKQFV